MARKHNTKHNRSRSKYPERLRKRGLSRPPADPYAEMTTMQIQQAFAKLPHYKWVERVNVDGQGRPHRYQEAVMIK